MNESPVEIQSLPRPSPQARIESLGVRHNEIVKTVSFFFVSEHLRNQVRLIKPKIIVCFGETAARKMIDPAFNLTEKHGQFIKKGKLYFMATFHPAEIIDNENKRELFLSDFQLLRETAKNAEII